MTAPIVKTHARGPGRRPRRHAAQPVAARTRPFFTRNIVIVTDNAGHTGLGEVPGGEKIRQTLEDARPLVEGQTDRQPAGDPERDAHAASPTATPAAAACRPSTCAPPSTR